MRLIFAGILFTSLLTWLPVSGNSLAEETVELSSKDKLVVETLLRLKSFDLDSSAPAKAAVLRYLRAKPGTDRSFELIERFKPVEIAGQLTKYSLAHPGETGGVRAAELLFAMNRGGSLSAYINSENEREAVSAVELIGHAAGKQTVPLLLPVVSEGKASATVRSTAVKALGKRADGQRELLILVTKGQLADELKFAAANVLLSSTDNKVAAEAAKYLELPATADSQPLPALVELVKRKGDPATGAEVFRTTGTCIKCHKIRGEGKEVGPDLTEIGSKLSREAMYVSILDPSAAISHNFETYSILTEDGLAVSGLLISETDDAVTLRSSDGIDKTIDKDVMEIFKKQKTSLMPQDLQKLLTVDQLVDLVEYALTLQKNSG